MPSLAAMILAISTSKPSGLPDSPLTPNSGWSNLVPTVSLPAAARSAIREPAAKLGLATGVVILSSFLSPPHAVRPSTSATAGNAEIRGKERIGKSFCGSEPAGEGRSVGEDLGQEVLGASGL